ncbi:MAG: TetR family transcriptional regulator [Candidatus Binatia bacterium]|nr:MAG: TetR family transcriptional regulator [Candidatus Binatia bacterium]
MVESIEVVDVPRRERKKRETRRRIYEAAVRLFLERGFDAVSIDEICERADVARGTFFLHFPTKDALLLEYGREVVRELADRLGRSPRPASEDLRWVFRSLARRLSRSAESVRWMILEALRRPTVLSETREQGKDFAGLLAGVVRRGQASGEFRREVDPGVAGAVLAATYFALLGDWALGLLPGNLSRPLERALDLVLRGLEPRDVPPRKIRGPGRRKP